jgi:hypothetical protein
VKPIDGDAHKLSGGQNADYVRVPVCLSSVSAERDMHCIFISYGVFPTSLPYRLSYTLLRDRHCCRNAMRHACNLQRAGRSDASPESINAGVIPHSETIPTPITLGIRNRAKPLVLKDPKDLPRGFDSHCRLQFLGVTDQSSPVDGCRPWSA